MIDGMVTVRSQSTRLPKKCFLEFGSGNVIEHIIRRAKEFSINPIVCTTIEEDDDRIVEIAKKENVRFYRGSVHDKLLRWRNACIEHKIDRFVTIDADDPFFDKELSHLSYSSLGNSFDLISHPPQQPSGGFYEGCVGFSLTLDIINKACEIKESDNTEMMWYFLDNVPEIRKSKLNISSEIKIDPIRLTLDYDEDYWLLRTVLRILGPFATQKEISGLFLKNPDLYKLNYFRNDEYKVNQEIKY